MPPKKRQSKALSKQATNSEPNQIDTNSSLPDTLGLRRSLRNLKKPKVDYKSQLETKEKKRIESESEDEDLSQDDQDEDHSDQILPQTDKTDITKPKVKKIRPRKFKKGKWNPSVEILDYELYRNKPGSQLLGLDNNVEIANLNTIRAVMTNDKKLMEKVVQNTKNISNLNQPMSVDVRETALDLLAESDQLELLNVLLQPQIDLEFYQDYKDQLNLLYVNRKEGAKELLDKVDTGMVSDKAYGFKVRPVEMMRGKREGNNAFLDRGNQTTKDLHRHLFSQDFLKKLLSSPKTTIEKLKVIARAVPGYSNLIFSNIGIAINSSNIPLAVELLKLGEKAGSGTLKNVQNSVLMLTNQKELSDEFLKKNALSQFVGGFSNTNYLMVSALDPSGDSLRRILKLLEDEETGKPKVDFYNSRSYCPFGNFGLCQFAAVCRSTENLKVLREYGVDFKENNGDLAALEVAIQFDRSQNMKYILETNLQYWLSLKFPASQQLNPLGLACRFGSINCLKTLIDLGANQMKAQGQDKSPPLCIAAKFNNFECVEALLDSKGRVNCRDQFKRTPLILAVKNGHSKVASLLLRRGADWEQPDSSLNTPMHYAAGFGWVDCIQLLLQTQAKTSSQNSWKMTPLQIAMLKQRKESIKLLLAEPGIDVNCKDQMGRNLLLTTLLTIDQNTEGFVKTIIEKGGNVSDHDLSLNNCLHQLVLYKKDNPELFSDSPSNKEAKEEIEQIQVKIAHLLIENGGDIYWKNENKSTPFELAHKSDQLALTEALLSKATLRLMPDFMFLITGVDLLQERYIKIIVTLLENERPSLTLINHRDDQGFSILLAFVKKFCYTFKEKVNRKNLDQYRPCISNFIILLQKLIEVGADPKATVGTLRKKEQEEVKKDQDDLRLTNWDIDKESTDEEDQMQVIPKKKGKKSNQAEEEKYGGDGLKNAWHFICQLNPFQFDEQLSDLLLSHKVSLNQKDLGGNTPLQTVINAVETDQQEAFKLPAERAVILQKFLKHGLKVDDEDTNGMTYFLRFIEKKEMQNAYLILKQGANINHLTKNKDFALKIVFLNQSLEQFKDFVRNCQALADSSQKLDTNLQDKMGRTVLHYALNNSLSTISASFESIRYLLDLKADPNCRDRLGRTPLHYAFHKLNQQLDDSTTYDPLEIVSNFLAHPGLEIDMADQYLKTPLHYAAQHGSQMSAFYLIKKEASLEKEDIYGNNPLASAFFFKQWNIAVWLMQQEKDLNRLVQQENYKRQNRIWARQKIDELQMLIGKGSKSKLALKFQESEEYDPNDEKPGLSGYPLWVEKIDCEFIKQLKSYEKEDKQPISKTDFFKSAILSDQQGLSYIALTGINKSTAIRSAIETRKWSVIDKIFEKIPHNLMFNTPIDENGNTLLHLFFKEYSTQSQGQSHNQQQDLTELKKYVNLFVQRGVDVYQVNNQGWNLLHLMCSMRNYVFINYLIDTFPLFDVNQRDVQQSTPFTLYNKGQFSILDNLAEKMIKKGADLNALYPISHLFLNTNPTISNRLIEEKTSISQSENQQTYMAPLLISQILNSDSSSAITAIRSLVKFGASITTTDEVGRDVFMVAVITNDTQILESLMEYFQDKVSPVLSRVDDFGKSAAHYAINPLHYGSYENDKMLKILHENKFNLALLDNDGKTPGDHASLQKTQKMLKMLKKLKVVSGDAQELVDVTQKETEMNDQIESGDQEMIEDKSGQIDSTQISKIGHFVHKKVSVDFEKDAANYISSGSANKKKALESEKESHELFEPWFIGKQYQVVKEGDLVYSVYLTKANIENFIGQYLFYKMQLLHDSNLDLYILLTRWGQVGEIGMNQRTPFESLEKGKKEFGKIFKQKTENVFEQVKQFKKVDKKYNLTEIKQFTFDYKELLLNFDWDTVPPSSLNKKVRSLLRCICHPKYYRDHMRDIQVARSRINQISQANIDTAKDILQKLEKAIQQDTNLTKDGLGGGNYALKLEVMENIYRLSNEYYELIPPSDQSVLFLHPFKSLQDIKRQYEILNQISYIGYISKILLAALHNQRSINPLDYIYPIFETEFQLLTTDTNEYRMLSTYIHNTWSSKSQQEYVANIFRVNKKGQSEALSQYKDLSNQKLLFHGSSIHNFVGIFYEGMQIEHSEGIQSGSSLGNGLYFADKFDKAIMFSRNNAFFDQNCTKASKLVLICEVALGKTKYLCSHTRIERLAAGYSSVKLRGKLAPDKKDTLIEGESGIKIPQGKVVNVIQKYHPELRYYVHNEDSEYCVYRPEQVRIAYVVQVRKSRLV